MNVTADREKSVIRQVVNSAGFWVLVFCAVGWLGLVLSESKFQSRMQRQAVQARLLVETEDSASLNPPEYGLGGLRWILAGGVLLGTGLLGVTCVRIGRQKQSRP